jgi:tRNA 2-thiouridine synthesizing protein A
MSASPIILDTSGLKCPLPVLKARKAMRDMPMGGVLRVIATDPGAVKDFEHFCKTTSYRLVEQREEAGKLVFEIEKA